AEGQQRLASAHRRQRAGHGFHAGGHREERRHLLLVHDQDTHGASLVRAGMILELRVRLMLVLVGATVAGVACRAPARPASAPAAPPPPRPPPRSASWPTSPTRTRGR